MTPTQLKGWRKSKHLSQPQAARILFISPPQYQKWEGGITAIPELVSAYISLIELRFDDIQKNDSHHAMSHFKVEDFKDIVTAAKNLYQSIWQRLPKDESKYCQIKAFHIHQIKRALDVLFVNGDVTW